MRNGLHLAQQELNRHRGEGIKFLSAKTACAKALCDAECTGLLGRPRHQEGTRGLEVLRSPGALGRARNRELHLPPESCEA